MKMQFATVVMVLAFLCLLSAGPAGAGPIPVDLRPTANNSTVKASSAYTDGGRLAWHVSDGTGMVWSPDFPTGSASNAADNVTWLTNGTSTGWIAWDLGASYRISKIHIWNYNENRGTNWTTRGVKTLALQTDDGSHWGDPNTGWTDALTGVDWTALPANGAGGDTSKGTTAYNTTTGGVKGNGGDTYTGFDWDLTTLATPITTRYLKFNIAANLGGDNYVGLSEVVFFAEPPAAVAEPATLGLLLLSIPLLKRRRLA